MSVVSEDATLKAAIGGDEAAFEQLIAPYLRELRVHCYRMAGSLHEADDLMQESLLKIWKGLANFEGRASLRTWLYKLVTNVCLDALEKRAPRLLPTGLKPEDSDPLWLEPCPSSLYRAAETSPAAHYENRQSIALAFLVAIQRLPAKQRATLILREVLGFEATECAELLGLSVAAVNSALQRARSTLSDWGAEQQVSPPTADHSDLLRQYVRAWEQADVNALVALLLKDATLAMPPMPQWLSGAEAIGSSIQEMVFAPAGPGVFRLIQTEANGAPAFAAYQRDSSSGEMRPMSIHVIEIADGRIASITAFLDGWLFEAFDLPTVL